MRGIILAYDPQRGEGLISGADEKRHAFKGTSFQSDFNLLKGGVAVDFDVQGDEAVAIYVVPPTGQDGFGAGLGEIGGKSRLVAGLLALFFGGLGIHKFYLGYNAAGVIMLLITMFGIILFGIPSIIIGIIAFIEGVIYLTKSDQDFYLTYVKGRKPWF